MADSTLIKKHLVRPFLNDGTSAAPVWVQIKKATEFTRSMNPSTEDYDYIADEHPTTEVTDYKPSETFAVKTFKGESDFDLFYKLYKARAIGTDAHKEILTVYVFDSSTVEDKTYYYAEKEDATITVSEFNATDSSISVDVSHNGTPTIGYVEITEGVPSFTAGDMPTA